MSTYSYSYDFGCATTNYDFTVPNSGPNEPLLAILQQPLPSLSSNFSPIYVLGPIAVDFGGSTPSLLCNGNENGEINANITGPLLSFIYSPVTRMLTFVIKEVRVQQMLRIHGQRRVQTFLRPPQVSLLYLLATISSISLILNILLVLDHILTTSPNLV